MEFFDMIPIPMLDGVVMHAPFRNTVDGTLCISSHHLILSSRKEGVEELWMLHRNIDLVERRPNGLSGGNIVIKCKDFRVIQLDINSPEEFVQVAACIENLASIVDSSFPPFLRLSHQGKEGPEASPEVAAKLLGLRCAGAKAWGKEREVLSRVSPYSLIVIFMTLCAGVDERDISDLLLMTSLDCVRQGSMSYTTLTLQRAIFIVEDQEEDVRLFYPFFYRHMSPILEDGWTAFTPETEYANLINSLADEWKISYVNKDFGVCPTYPSAVVVPKSIDDETIIAAANFREGGRFPVLSYRHEGGSVLMRSSQPMTGPNSKRCKEDERLINSVLGPGKRGYIIDTRTQTLAQTAKVQLNHCFMNV
uniref:Myotubularin phosphatase domain-containing protein n=1 Tax=Timema cristinae TaxID=61476 RepID=A0A7R9GVY4_TIMCR|nr:unnamed protein product [Timema cristinae]